MLLALAAGLVPFTAVVLVQLAAVKDRTLTVAIDGSGSSPGTVTAPLLTIQRAVDLVGPGTVIQIRGGIYEPSVNIRAKESGTPS